MNDKPQVPRKIGQVLSRGRNKASGLKTVVAVASLIAAVLAVTVVVAVWTGSDWSGGHAAGKTEGGQTGLDLVADFDSKDFPADGVYRMKVAGGDLCLTAKEHSDDKLELVQSKCDESADLTAFAVGKGVYRITGGFGSDVEQCLAAGKKSAKSGASIAPAECTDDPLQTFVTVPVKGDRTYALATATSGVCLAPAKGSGKSGTPVRTVECEESAKDQRVTLEKQDTIPALHPASGSYEVTVASTGLCLGEGPEQGVKKDRNVLVQQDCDAKTTGLTFTPEKGAEATITMNAVAADWANCLAADPPGDEYGYLFGATKCDDGEKLQKFTLEPYGGSVYRIKVAESGLCMGIKEQGREPGTQADMTDCEDGQLSQLFTLTPETT